MSDVCLEGLSHAFCAFKGCGKRLSRGSKTGFCRQHSGGKGVYENTAWTVVRKEVLDEWNGEK